MLFHRASIVKRAKGLRKIRDKGFFIAGILVGAAVSGVALKLLVKLKCKSCVKRMLSEKQ